MLQKLLILSVFSFSVFAQAEQSLIEMIEDGASVQEIQSAIQQGADVNPKAGFFSKKRSTLITAIENKRPEVAKLLVSYGADVNVKNNAYNKKTALMLAILYEEVELTDTLLIAGADVNTRDDYKRTALMYAGEVENLYMMTILLLYGADVNARDKDGNSPL
ncbi:MAG: ankyrin repeat domain-containing protein, partial [Bdellovibrionales bacterium]